MKKKLSIPYIMTKFFQKREHIRNELFQSSGQSECQKIKKIVRNPKMHITRSSIQPEFSDIYSVGDHPVNVYFPNLLTSLTLHGLHRLCLEYLIDIWKQILLTIKVLYMSFDRFLLAFESRDLTQADKSIIRMSSFPSFNFWW